VDERGLADPGFPVDEDEAAAARGGAGERAAEALQLGFALEEDGVDHRRYAPIEGS
jgi:hypothetical protein